MKPFAIRVVIMAALVLEAMWALQPHNLLWPRSPETVRAIDAYRGSPGEVTKAALTAQLRRDSSRNAQHDRVVLAVILVADVVVICFFWNSAGPKPAG